jgi:hypothetical protein
MTGEPRFVDVQFRGLRLAQRARLLPRGDTAGFVELETPLPVGTVVRIVEDGGMSIEARVVAVVEQEAGARSAPGMALDWAPAPAVEPAPPPEDTSSIAVSSTDLLPVEEVDEAADESGTPEPPAPTDGKRRRRNKKTIIGRPS